MDYSNFFTIDVAHFIGMRCSDAEKSDFVLRHSKYLGTLAIPGISEVFDVDENFLAKVADHYLEAIKEVKKI